MQHGVDRCHTTESFSGLEAHSVVNNVRTNIIILFGRPLCFSNNSSTFVCAFFVVRTDIQNLAQQIAVVIFLSFDHRQFARFLRSRLDAAQVIHGGKLSYSSLVGTASNRLQLASYVDYIIAVLY